jgi:hypothetical protein
VFYCENTSVSPTFLIRPFAFTGHGVSMLASVLRSEKAVQMIEKLLGEKASEQNWEERARIGFRP